MLDGRVLGASQVEYKPFGKLPLKRELAQLQVVQNEPVTKATLRLFVVLL